MAVVYCWKLCSTFRRILRSGPSGMLQCSDFHTIIRGQSWTGDIVLEIRLLPPCAELLLLLELSSLAEVWSVDSLSVPTTCYIAERRPTPVLGYADWSELLVDLRLDFSCCLVIGQGTVVWYLGLEKRMALFIRTESLIPELFYLLAFFFFVETVFMIVNFYWFFMQAD